MATKEPTYETTGKVRNCFAGEDSDEGMSINLWLTNEQVEKIEELLSKREFTWTGDRYPVKFDEEEDRSYLKLHTNFHVLVDGLPKGCIPADIGSGSEVNVAFSMKQGTYRGKSYVSAYLKAVYVTEFVQREDTNPFKGAESL